MEQLGDFTLTVHDLRLVPLALVASALATITAVVLLDMIGLVTNLGYYGRVDVSLVQPPTSGLGLGSVLIPVGGGLVIGLLARYGSERIRGHGIPEAMESILVGGSKVQPRLALLKPISSAISIGTGGPFGAEGPIIMTGGAIGSLIGQLEHLSAAERKTLLVAGAAAGMTAVFGTPLAAVLLGTELLLFEWRPRSLLPVAAAAALAAAIRFPLADHGLLAAVPLFPVPAHLPLGDAGLAGALGLGLVGGLVAWALTACVYGAEDLFKRLPVHWMWWPAIGGLAVGLGGLIDPRALGVGYDSLRAELAGDAGVRCARPAAGHEAGDLVDRARIGHERRDPRAAAPDRRRGGWAVRAPAARWVARRVGPDRDGGGAGRRDAVAVHVDPVRVRTEPRPERLPAPARGLCQRLRHQRARAQAFDPDGEGRAARVPRDARVRGRAARGAVRSRRDGDERPVRGAVALDR